MRTANSAGAWKGGGGGLVRYGAPSARLAAKSGERKYHLPDLPADTAIKQLAGAIKARWVCEQAHQQLKQELHVPPADAGPRPVADSSAKAVLGVVVVRASLGKNPVAGEGGAIRKRLAVGPNEIETRTRVPLPRTDRRDQPLTDRQAADVIPA